MWSFWGREIGKQSGWRSSGFMTSPSRQQDSPLPLWPMGHTDITKVTTEPLRLRKWFCYICVCKVFMTHSTSVRKFRYLLQLTDWLHRVLLEKTTGVRSVNFPHSTTGTCIRPRMYPTSCHFSRVFSLWCLNTLYINITFVCGEYWNALHNDVLVNDGPHIRRLSHNIIIL